MMGWLTNLFRPAPPRELVFVDYRSADQMLRENSGWKLAKEEDTNRQPGFVYLERPAPQHTAPHGKTSE